jgi:flagellar motor switch protein FliN/FliY
VRNENLSQEEIEQLLQEAGQAADEEHNAEGQIAGDVLAQTLAEDVPEDIAGKEAQETVLDDKQEDVLADDDTGTAEPGEPAKPGESPETAQPSIRLAEFEEFRMEPASEKPISDIGVLMDIPLSISVELGKSKCYVKDLLNLTAGSIVELDRLAGDPVDILVNGKLFAKGEVVVIDENFGVRIQEVLGKDKSR